ncbi:MULTISPECIES: glycoside hydrolase family 3 C-terminal domain-containing protein [Chitinophaga]|uniref:glycoside hydrolase family 3 C-terminal domain-containing protein n=1 Tax=Chitinophaga TaxID=79328 RepID=UPI001CECB059|nr:MULTISPECIES: glycoside hydrolase family 3 C-terminal domain-containing protein [Chitinophaga]
MVSWRAGGHALAYVLFGRSSPSGRLPVTFYKSFPTYPNIQHMLRKDVLIAIKLTTSLTLKGL